VVGSVWLGHELAQRMSVIPAWLIRLPAVTLTTGDLQTISLYFGTIGLATFLGISLFSGANGFAAARRVAVSVYGLIFAISASALALFFTTEVNFDAETLLATALVAFGLFVAIYLLRLVMFGSLTKLAAGLMELAVAGLSMPLRRPLALLVLVVACLPIVTAKLFVSDRDFANTVTQIRIALSADSSELPTKLVNAFPGIFFNQPMMIRFDPLDIGVVYVLDRKGRLYRLEPQHTEKQLLLDISDRVGYVEVENGALGFDLHPQFGRKNDFVYVYFTSVEKDVSQTNYLSRFDLGASDPEGRAQSEFVLMELGRNTSGFHNGGTVEFGPDGMLYLAVGEASDVPGHQRIDRSLFGGVLRIDVDKTGGDVSAPPARQPHNGATAGYYLPLDNPFVDVPGALGEFWALGLRNPFRISFDPQTGELWAGDVGSTKWEEINIIEKGANYQFPYVEGVEATGSPKPAELIGDEVQPTHHYIHTAYRRAVIGGSVYRGSGLEELSGHYIFGDNYSGEIFSLDPQTQNEPRVIARADQVAQRGMTSLVNGPDGTFYITTLGAANQETGSVSKLVHSNYEASEAELTEPMAESTPVSRADAQSLYNTNCARCHGRSGDGDTEDAEALGVPMPDFTSDEFHQSRTDERLRRVTMEGGAAVGLSPLMPPWKPALSESEIEAMVDYLRTMRSASEQ